MSRLWAESHASAAFAGIFAFKCSRAEEIFNMLQEVMHSHSISVVEEAVLEPTQQAAHTPAGTHSCVCASRVALRACGRCLF